MSVPLKSKPKVLITGGAGFIGSHLAEAANSAADVTVLDDVSSGKKANLDRLSGRGVRVVSGSVTDLPLLRRLMENIDLVFHLAAIASVPRSIEDPGLAHEVNVTGTLNVLLAARDSRVKRLVFASSAAVYGNGVEIPKQESMLPEPASPYAANKIAGEHYCRVFKETYGLSTVALRLFNVYGPGQDPDAAYAGVIPRFIKLALENKPLVIFGDGKQVRDFVYIGDVARVMLLAARSDVTGVYNIGSGVQTTVNEVASLVLKLAGKNPGLVYKESRPGDVAVSQADISRARSFGYDPKLTLEEGLKLTVEAFKNGLPDR